jgi:hypothetical protein
MRLTMELKPASRQPQASRSASWVIKPVAIEAMVIDERRRPVELVPGARPLRWATDELSLATDLPLLPGSHVLVQVGDRHARDAASKRFEVEVLRCRRWIRGHEVFARVVGGTPPGEWRRAA